MQDARHTTTLSRREMLALACASGLSACGVPSSAPQQTTHSRGTRPPNVVLYLSDTLRADHLGCYGHVLDVSPNIDALSRKSCVFQNCFAQGCWTKPSIASLITGVVPRIHQASLSSWNFADLSNERVQILRPAFKTIAESLASAGYKTALFLTNPHVQREFGFGRGYENYQYVANQDPRSQMTDVLHWLATQAEEPFFLFVHQMDPHAPYTPLAADYEDLYGETPTAARERLDDRDADLLKMYDVLFDSAHAGEGRKSDLKALSASAWAHLRSLYSAEIRKVDREFGRLLRTLSRLEWLDRSMVIFTADHGESFGEHNAVFHANFVFNEETHVPLIVKMPGQRDRMPVPHTVPLLDVYATILEAAGAAIPDYVQSRPLFDSTSSVLADREAFSEFSFHKPDVNEWAVACTKGRHKVLWWDEGREIRAYDLALDPGEQNDLFATGAVSEEFEALLASATARCAQFDTIAHAMGEAEWSTMDGSTRELLEALGYVRS